MATDVLERYDVAGGEDVANEEGKEGLAAVGERMIERMTPLRLVFTWWGADRAMTTDQNRRAAATFDANAERVAGSKRVVDRKYPALAALQRERTRIVNFRDRMSLPYPEVAMRLVRTDDVNGIVAELDRGRARIHELAIDADRHLPEMIEQARTALGSLFNEGDYPRTLVGHFDLFYDFPPTAPPQWMLDQHPELYRREAERLRVRFEAAAREAEDGFVEEFGTLVSRLVEGLNGGKEGDGPRAFRDGAADRLQKFFERFRQFDMGFDGRLSGLIDDAESAVRGVTRRAAANNSTLRERVAKDLTAVGDAIAAMMVERPRLRVLRERMAAAATTENEPVADDASEASDDGVAAVAPEAEGAL